MSSDIPIYVIPTPDGGWRVAATRVSLASVVHAYWEGLAPEEIVGEFPSLSLEEAHGAIAFYLRHRPEVDSYLATQAATWARVRHESQTRNADVLGRLRAVRRRGAPSISSPQ